MSRHWSLCAPAASALLVLVLGCQSGDGGGVTDIHYGARTCTECGEKIKDPRFTAQYKSADGLVKAFDDPGCLFRALRQEGEEPSEIYFHDHDSDAWLAAPDVWFAKTPQTETPHAYGWAAYASFAAAQDAVTSAGGGEILQFGEARKRTAGKGP